MPGHDPQLLKGVLTLLLLQLFTEREDYGYSVLARLHEQGFPDVAEGTVYPALSRLQSQGLLASHLVPSTSGPARKYYRITAPGREELDRASLAWRQLNATVERILTPPPAPPPLPPPAPRSPAAAPDRHAARSTS